jgi:hypothetical protein
MAKSRKVVKRTPLEQKAITREFELRIWLYHADMPDGIEPDITIPFPITAKVAKIDKLAESMGTTLWGYLIAKRDGNQEFLDELIPKLEGKIGGVEWLNEIALPADGHHCSAIVLRPKGFYQGGVWYVFTTDHSRAGSDGFNRLSSEKYTRTLLAG